MGYPVTKVQRSIIVWNPASEPPDADIEVLIGTTDGDVYLGIYNDDDACYETTTRLAMKLDARYWAEVPEVPHA